MVDSVWIISSELLSPTLVSVSAALFLLGAASECSKSFLFSSLFVVNGYTLRLVMSSFQCGPAAGHGDVQSSVPERLGDGLDLNTLVLVSRIKSPEVGWVFLYRRQIELRH
jgi:hypothetical protein